jgi:hypothetical protein
MTEIQQFFPLKWSGKTKMDQYELFDQVLMYLTQHELHKTYAGKITHKEWIKKSDGTMHNFSHRLACQFTKDILHFYRLPELDCGFADIRYIEDKNTINRTYAMYDDYFDNCRYSIICKYEMIHIYMSVFTAY